MHNNRHLNCFQISLLQIRLLWTYLCTSSHVNNSADYIPTCSIKNCPAKIMYQLTFPLKLCKESPILHTPAKVIIIHINFCQLIKEDLTLDLTWTLFVLFFCLCGEGYFSLRIMGTNFKFIYIHKHWTNRIPSLLNKLIPKWKEIWE